MSYCITFAAVRDVLGVHKNSVTHWTRGLPRQRGTGANRPHYLRFDNLVVALREKRKRGLSGDDLHRIVDLVQDDHPSDYLEDADSRAAALLDALTVPERERFDRVRKWAHTGFKEKMWFKEHLVNLPHALDLLILRPTVADYVFTRRRRESFPATRDQWGDYCAMHVHATATPAETKNLSS